MSLVVRSALIIPFKAQTIRGSDSHDRVCALAMDELHRFDAEVADDAVKRELAVDSQDGDGEGS